MTKTEIIRSAAAGRRASARWFTLNALAFYCLALLTMAQQGIDAPLVDDFQGLELVMLTCFALCLFNFWRAARCLIGRDS